MPTKIILSGQNIASLKCVWNVKRMIIIKNWRKLVMNPARAIPIIPMSYSKRNMFNHNGWSMTDMVKLIIGSMFKAKQFKNFLYKSHNPQKYNPGK